MCDVFSGGYRIGQTRDGGLRSHGETDPRRWPEDTRRDRPETRVAVSHGGTDSQQSVSHRVENIVLVREKVCNLVLSGGLLFVNVLTGGNRSVL